MDDEFHARASGALVRFLILTVAVVTALLLLSPPALAVPADAAGLVTAQTGATDVPHPKVTHLPQELTLITLTNDYREKHGLSRLLVSDLLTEAAKRHASDMAKYDFFDHLTVKSDWFRTGSTYTDRMAACGYAYVTPAAELLGVGQSFDAETVFELWSNLLADNGNMLNPDFKVLGAGVAEGDWYGYYWTVDFGGYVDPTAHSAFPPAPAGLTAVPGNGQVRLSWSAVTGATAYNVYRDGAKVTAAAIDDTTYTDPGLTNGTTYSYQVTAVVCGNETAESRPVTGKPSAVTAQLFLDVPATSPYYQAIQAIGQGGAIDGYTVQGGREFRPNDPVKRAQFAKMIVGALRLACSEDMTSHFTDLGDDVQDNLYPHEYVAAAFATGIIKGKSATMFAPWDAVKRSQVVTMVVRALQNLYPAALATPPADYTNTWGVTYAAEQGPLARLAEFNGLLDGLPLTTTALDPWGGMPRGEVAQVLWNVMRKLGLG